MKNLHVIAYEKFTDSYIKFINSNFDTNEHLFVVFGDNVKFKVSSSANTLCLKKDIKSILSLISSLNRAEKVILHGLFSSKVTILLFLQPWLLKKCNWVVWGGDLYKYKYRDRSIKSYFYEYIRKTVIKNMGGLITHIKGDYELAKEWYGAKGKYYYSFVYPSNLYKEYDVSKDTREDRSKLNIQLGNSADPSNNHIEILQKLEPYKDENIEIICPLSYGDKEIREKVIAIGKKIFQDKFYPLIEFVPFDKYLELLAKVDVAIFNHNRQQGMGNIITLLGLGKKVYIRDDISSWDFCMEHNLKVYSANGDLENLYEKMTDEVKKNNIDNIRRQFSEEKLVNDLRIIFK